MNISDQVNKKIQQHLDSIDKLALAEVDRIVRKILKENSTTLMCFRMSMGSWCFYDTDSNTVSYEFHDYAQPILQELEDFISNWDHILRITGNYMHVTLGMPTSYEK
jgi:hypothetical protein